MQFSISKESFAKVLATTETTLNLVGYIPMISAISGAMRLTGAKLQMLTGLCAALFFFFKGYHGNSSKTKNFQRCRLCVEQILHGAFNLCRGFIEVVPFLSLLICLPYDRFFHKRFKYSSEGVELSKDDIIDI